MSSLDTILNRRLGQGNGTGPYAAGPGGECICPKCGHVESHKTGESCLSTTCPKCGSEMVRKDVSKLSNRKAQENPKTYKEIEAFVMDYMENTSADTIVNLYVYITGEDVDRDNLWVGVDGVDTGKPFDPERPRTMA